MLFHRKGRNNHRENRSPAGSARPGAHTRDLAMVSRLRRQFVATAMTSLLIIVVLMIAVINVANFYQIDSSAVQTLQILADNGGEYPNQAPDAEETDTDPPETDALPDRQAPEANAANSGGSARGTDTADADSADETGQSGPETDTADSGSDGGPAQEGPQSDPGSGRGGPRSFPASDLNETRRIEAPFETRYFSVLIDAEGAVSTVNIDHIAAIDEETAAEYALTVLYNGRSKGYASSYRYRTAAQSDGGTLVLFVDCSSDLATAQQLLFASLFVGAAALLLMFALVWLLSGRAVSPVVESLEKQKRFISDAGHELKTPITVISANVAVLEMTGVKNEWTDSIRSQTRRMTDLVNNMLTLSRMEEDAGQVPFTDVNFSALVYETAGTFEAVAQADGLDYNVSIQDGLHVDGDTGALRQLCTVLLDNAMKYASLHGSVYISLKAERREGGIRAKRPACVILEVSNTCDAIPEGNLDRLFDRFYRADASRTRRTGAGKPRSSAAGYRSEGLSEEDFRTGRSSSTGGFGIGLSVAKAVAVSHGGSITARADGDRLIRFRVTLPLKKSGEA